MWALRGVWRSITDYPLCVFTALAFINGAVAFVLLLAYSSTNRTIEECEARESIALRKHGRDGGDDALRNTTCPLGFLINTRGRKLYYRVLTPDDGDARCLMVLLHGYAAHFNRPTYMVFLRDLLAKGIAVATLDLEGHGYSEGVRCFIEDGALMVDDAEQFVELIASGKALVSQLGTPGVTAPGATSTAGEAIAGLPLFLGGQSMGGGLALLLSRRVCARFEHFRGCVLLCPAFACRLPPVPVVFFLRHVVAAMFPLSAMPAFLDATFDGTANWRGEALARWHARDVIGTPGGLGWGGAMRWGTAASLLGVIDDAQAALPGAAFPLLLLHDPSDRVVPFEDARRLLARAVSEDRTVVEMRGSLHDQMCNSPAELSRIIEAWMGPRCKTPQSAKTSGLLS